MPHISHFTASAAPRFPRFQVPNWWTRRSSRLDLNALPDHLKRDLGFMGGRSSPLRDILRD
jgi:uncharacterized protein YjiS (DUF1127 family)